MSRRTILTASLLGLLGLFLLPATLRAEEPQPEPERPTVEVVFVLDTTGSMGGLLEGAKQKIWSIVNEIAKGKPTPDIRVGLVGYRDKGDAYVTRRHDLTDDLDAMFQALSDFQAGGGGDGPEHVNQALHEAVHQMSWSEDGLTLRILFLVGDAPPHMDYDDDVKYTTTVEEAVRKDIIINAIRCGTWAETGTTWSEIARLGEGEFLTIDQSGGTIAIATPFDEALADASRKLSGTYVGYGTLAEMEDTELALAAGDAAPAAPEATAARAEFRARKLAMGEAGLAANDLVDLFSRDRDGFDKLDAALLPAELQEMTPEERAVHLEALVAKRQAIQQQILELSKERDAFVKAKLEELGGEGDAFDQAVQELIKEKAEAKGITYED